LIPTIKICPASWSGETSKAWYSTNRDAGMLTAKTAQRLFLTGKL